MCMCCLYSIPVMIRPITFRMIMYVRCPVMMRLNRVLVCDSVLQEIQSYMPARPFIKHSLETDCVCRWHHYLYRNYPTNMWFGTGENRYEMHSKIRESSHKSHISSPCTFVTASVPIFRISVHDAWYHISLWKYRARLIKYRLQKRKTWCRKWRDQSSDQAIFLLHISKSD